MSEINKEGIIIIASLLLTILIIICLKFCDYNNLKNNLSKKIKLKTINYETI